MTNELEPHGSNAPLETDENQPVLPKFDFPPVDEVYAPLPDAVGSQAKQSGKLRLLLVLALIAALLGGLLVYNNHFAFYERTLRNLNFDYQNGETTSKSFPTKSQYAQNIAKNLYGKTISLHTVMYAFDSAQTLQRTLTVYDYSVSPDSAEMTAKTGTTKWLFTDTQKMRMHGSTVEEHKNGHWEEVEANQFPYFDLFFFATENTDQYSASLYDSYPTTVGSTLYHCEVWLIELYQGNSPIYYTLYRYYLNDKLTAVRMLNDRSDLMYVYDIQDYTIE